MKCPSCGDDLQTIEYEGVKIETCPGCKGEWLDADELGSIVRARDVKFNEAERRAIAKVTSVTGVVLKDVDRDLPCPKCGGATDAVNYASDTGIIIDRCTGCGGFWLDGEELENIQKLVEGWEDLLPEDLEQYSAMLHDIEPKSDDKAQEIYQYSHIPLIGKYINLLIHNIVNLGET